MSPRQVTQSSEVNDIVPIIKSSPQESEKKKKKKKGKGVITLDEVIVILDCDPRTLSPKELRKYGELCTRKTTQEKLEQESKSKEILENVRDILQ